jgi:hypothetical protein
MEHKKNIIPIFDKNFEFPDESKLPADVRNVTKFNGINWVHEYQEACVDKLERYIVHPHIHAITLCTPDGYKENSTEPAP